MILRLTQVVHRLTRTDNDVLLENAVETDNVERYIRKGKGLMIAFVSGMTVEYTDDFDSVMKKVGAQ